MRKYEYLRDREVPKLPAQEVGEELERVKEKLGELTPQGLVDESRPKTALLHKELDLDKSLKERAERWARHKARNVINVVVLPPLPKEEGGLGNEEPVRAFVSVLEPTEANPLARRYETMEEVLEDPSKRAAMIERAKEKLLRVQREFRHLKELEAVWAAISAAVA